MHSATCSRMNSVFSRRLMEPKVSTCNSHNMSVAAAMSPWPRLISDRMRVTLARSTSTKIYPRQRQLSHSRADTKLRLRKLHTLPSVTVLNVSMTPSLVSVLGASSKKPMTTCTILVMACLSCPCFLLSSRTCSFSKLQSPESFEMVTMATSRREVEARSDACLVCFSSARSLSMDCCVWPS